MPLPRFLSRKHREPQPKYETCIFLDPGDEGETIYWRGSLPQDDLLAVDPYARSRSVADPGQIRRLVYFIGPAISFLLVFATAFLAFSPSPTAWLPSILISAVFGWELGLGAAALVHYFLLRPQATWLFRRIPADNSNPGAPASIDVSAHRTDLFAAPAGYVAVSAHPSGPLQPRRVWTLEPIAPSMPVPHIEGRPFVIRDDFMKRVSQQLAMRFTFRSRNTTAKVIQMTSLVVIAVGMFALIFLVNAMVSNNG